MMTRTISLGLIAATLALGACQKKPSSGSSTANPGGPAGAPTGGAARDQAEPVAASAPSGDWSLGERSLWEQIYADRQQYIDLMNTACGSEIEMKFDEEAFRDLLPNVEAHRHEDWSSSAMITAIRSLCLEGALQKTAVATKIETIVFERAPSKHALRQRTLRIALDPQANPRAYVGDFDKWLRASL
jgi:hypothetical protein